MEFHSRMIFLSTRPLWTPLVYWGWNWLACHSFSFFLQHYLLLLRWFLSEKRYLYIVTIIWSLYFFMVIHRLSRYFLISRPYFDVKMAISNNRHTRLLEVIIYPLNYLSCGFSLQASFFVFSVVRFTVSLSRTSILL